jgi:hypothetical protein
MAVKKGELGAKTIDQSVIPAIHPLPLRAAPAANTLLYRLREGHRGSRTLESHPCLA